MLFEPEPTPLDMNWRMFGTHVRVHPFFWLLCVILGWGSVARGFQFVLIWVACVFVSILLHEFGHVLVGRLFGSDGRIVLYSFGGIAIGSSNLAKRWQRVAVILAGPAVQLLLFALLRQVDGQFPRPPFSPQNPRFLAWFGLQELLFINLWWPVLNLLPIWPLDGGQISRELLEGLLGRMGNVIALGASFVLAGLLALHSLAAEWGKELPLVGKILPSGGYYTAILFALLAVGSLQALRQVQARRRWEVENPTPPWEDEEAEEWRR